jgi:hypothetical protein
MAPVEMTAFVASTFAMALLPTGAFPLHAVAFLFVMMSFVFAHLFSLIP